MVYYGPGIANPGTIDLKSNQTLYLAGGAYVKVERVNCIDTENVKIMGKGILVTSGKRAITFKNCNNMLIQDIVQLQDRCGRLIILPLQ